MWISLLNWLLGYLGPFIAAFAQNFEKATRDNPAIMNIAYDLVVRTNREHPEWTGAQKRAYALDTLAAYIKEMAHDVGEALQRTILELAVQKAKKDGVA